MKNIIFFSKHSKVYDIIILYNVVHPFIIDTNSLLSKNFLEFEFIFSSFFITQSVCGVFSFPYITEIYLFSIFFFTDWSSSVIQMWVFTWNIKLVICIDYFLDLRWCYLWEPYKHRKNIFRIWYYKALPTARICGPYVKESTIEPRVSYFNNHILCIVKMNYIIVRY